MCRCAGILLASLLSLCAPLAPAPLSAQAIDGTLIDAERRAPVPGAVVVLLDDTGSRLQAALTDGEGRFALRAPEPGRYRIRSERVGYQTTVSAPLTLREEETRSFQMVTEGTAIELEAIQAQAGDRGCAVRPGGGARTAVLWEEARKALSAAQLAEEQGSFSFTVRRFRRNLDPVSRLVRGEDTETATGRRVAPFASLPAEQLAEGGYVQRTGGENVFYAPDAQVLLSDAFLDGHCFQVADAPGGDPGLVGLAFEPLRGRDRPDVRGVLWLDARTGQLQHLDYSYTGLRVENPDGDWGGRIEFARTPGGAWIVQRWTVRMPVVGTRRDGGSLMTRQRQYLVGIREEGGEVVGIAAASEDALHR